MKLKDIFNEKGNFRVSFDPYRCPRNHQFYEALFDCEGDLKIGRRKLRKLIEQKEWGPFSDAVALYHADEFAGDTKGNYSTIYYWR